MNTTKNHCRFIRNRPHHETNQQNNTLIRQRRDPPAQRAGGGTLRKFLNRALRENYRQKREKRCFFSYFHGYVDKSVKMTIIAKYGQDICRVQEN